MNINIIIYKPIINHFGTKSICQIDKLSVQSLRGFPWFPHLCLDSVHGLLRFQLCNDIQNQEIGVLTAMTSQTLLSPIFIVILCNIHLRLFSHLLWKQTSGFLELHQPGETPVAG